MRRLAISLCLVLLAGAAEVSELRVYPIDSLKGVVTRDGVRFDRSVSSDGNGSLRLKARKPATFVLFETGDLDVERATLIYRAKVRTRHVKGEAYLEMWCHFPNQEQSYSRGMQYSLSGTNDWTAVETTFVLRKGENPDNIKLDFVIHGKGSVWIDDVQLVKGELPPGA